MTAAGGVTYTYDNNGNQTGRGSDTFGWDRRPSCLSHRRGNHRLVHLPWRRSAQLKDDRRHDNHLRLGPEFGSAGRPAGRHHHLPLRPWLISQSIGPDLPGVLDGVDVVGQTTGSRTSYFLTDGLGSTVGLADKNGALTALYKYDVFGADRGSTGSGSTDFPVHRAAGGSNARISVSARSLLRFDDGEIH
jgi:hypothetical protein